MALFTVEAFPAKIEPIPGADRLEKIRIGGFVSLAPKGNFRDGQLVLYIPEAALVPESMLTEMGLMPKDGSALRPGKPIGHGDRVKAVKFMGVLSQGLVYVPEGIELTPGIDYAEQLGIEKWEPEIKAGMQGNPYVASGIQRYSDPENCKRYPDALVDGEEVAISEKIHGSCCLMHFDASDASFHVSSKGMAGQGFALEDEKDDLERSKNQYWRAAHQYDVAPKLAAIAAELGVRFVTLYGEVYGSGIQDLQYGLDRGAIAFRAFDLRADGNFVDYPVFVRLTGEHGIDTAPVLYVGPYSDEVLAEHTDGKTELGAEQIREGVVVKPTTERRDEQIGGRVILKSISEKYVLRRGGTEYN